MTHNLPVSLDETSTEQASILDGRCATHGPQHHREMGPGRIADVALEHADGVRNLLRSAPVVVDERRSEGGVGGAVDAGPQRAEVTRPPWWCQFL